MNERGIDIRPPHFIFLARHFNDIDHVVPVIWGLLKNGVSADRIRYIVLYPDPSIEPCIDPRLKFIEEHGVQLEMPHLTGMFRLLIYKISTAAAVGRTIRRKARKLLYRKLVANTANKDYILNVISASPHHSILLSDHAVTEDLRTFTEAIHKRKGTSVGLPHGFQLHTGFTDAKFDAIMKPKKDALSIAEIFDTVLVCNPTQFNNIAPPELQTSVHSMGAIRFSPNWLEQLSKLYPVKNTHKTKKLRILMLLEKGGITLNGRHWEFLDIDEQFRALKHLADHPGIELRIKGNARGLSHRQGKLARPYRNLTVEDAIHTHALISWADLVVGCCSSVLMDAYARNKPVMLLEYATRLKMVYKDFDFHKNPQSFEEFCDKLNKFVEARDEKLYEDSRLQRMIEYYVYGGKGPHDVADSYAQYLKELTER